MNQTIFNFFGMNETWSIITDILLTIAILVLGVFAFLGLIQWIQRKNIMKVDKELLFMLPSLVLMLVIYVVFMKVWIINYRPILIDGIAEPSFPSSHTMATTTILLMAIKALPKYIENKRVRIILSIAMVVVIFAVAFGRVASGMHWFTDVLGGVIFGWVLSSLYQLLLVKFGKEKEKDE